VETLLYSPLSDRLYRAAPVAESQMATSALRHCWAVHAQDPDGFCVLLVWCYQKLKVAVGCSAAAAAAAAAAFSGGHFGFDPSIEMDGNGRVRVYVVTFSDDMAGDCFSPLKSGVGSFVENYCEVGAVLGRYSELGHGVRYMVR
jgi:hypothetical protein